MDRIGDTVQGYTITRLIAADPRTLLYQVERGSEVSQLRVLIPELSRNPRAADRFCRGAAALQAVDHPGLVRILGTGTLPDGCVYVLSQPISGVLLSDLADAERATLALPVLRQLAAALAALHQHHVAYLGLQPERVLVRVGSGAPVVQLLDAETVRSDGEVTPDPTLADCEVRGITDPILYKAPECFLGRDAPGSPADVYALAALVYLMLAGRPPCGGKRTGEVTASHLNQVPPPLRERATSTPTAVADLVDTMLAKDPGRRPDMGQVARLLTQQPPATQPEGAGDATLQQFHDYQVVRLLGEGGMGQVYEAFSARQQRRAAIKIMRPELVGDPQQAEAFLQEVRAANLINHPGIVTILQADRAPDGRPYIVMEHLEETLRARIERGPLSALAAGRLARHMAVALAAAHDRGIIHRDLKPENVGVIRDESVVGGERTKILDFGIAKLAQPPTGQPGAPPRAMVIGTPAYMPPEQFKDAGQVNDRADVYALGVMLYEMLQGQLPPGRPPLGPQHPPDLTRLIGQLTSHDPAQRPSMKDAAIQLELMDAGLAQKQRSRGGLYLALALGAAGVAVAAGIGWWTSAAPAPAPTPAREIPPGPVRSAPRDLAEVQHPADHAVTRRPLARDCREARSQGHRSGVYSIKVDGAPRSPLRVYCEMNVAGGGWSLCLNAQYTSAAQHLFTERYERHFLDHGRNDPFGYYDFCQGDTATENEYLYALGRRRDNVYDLRGLVIHLKNAVGRSYNQDRPARPGDDGGVFRGEELTAALTDVVWISNDLPGFQPDMLRMSDRLTIALWTFQRSNGGLTTESGRGLIDNHLQKRSGIARMLVVGAGCKHRGCSGDAIAGGDRTLLGDWDWTVSASAGVFIDNQGWQDGTAFVRGERVLLFWRPKAPASP